jgi:hypothetical protein
LTPRTKHHRTTSLCLIGIALVLLNGCRLSYRLQGQGPTTILIPPVSPVTAAIKVPHARSHPAALDGCDIENGLLGLEWFGDTAEIRLQSESYFPAPGDERPEETAPRVYLDSAQKIEAFRNDLKDRVRKGCLQASEARALTRVIVEELPFPPLIGHFIRFGSAVDGVVDLAADFRLKVVSPVRDATKEVAGYGIAWYRIEPAPKDARVRISPVSASAGPPLVFPGSFLYFRLLFRNASSPTDHLATILGSDDQVALDHATSRFQTERDLSCAALAMPHVTCIMPAPDISVNVEFPVSVNRRQVFVPLNGTVLDAMQPRTRVRGSRPLCTSEDCFAEACAQ